MKKILFFIVLCYFSIHSLSQNLKFKGFEILKQVPATPVKDQSMSSTCWCFATISYIESELLRQGIGGFDLSEMYIV